MFMKPFHARIASYPFLNHMKKLLAPVLVSSALLFTACGVDTTGLSAESSRTMMGSETALVTLTEFGDLQCPACKAAHDILTKPLMTKYDGKIRFEFKHFPLRNIHVYALEAAEAAECAADQGKFWQFFDLTYANQDRLSGVALREWAAELNLDAALFDRCVKSNIKEKTILADFAEGSKLGVNSTPSYFVNGVRVPNNTLETLSAAIDAALKNSSQVPL